MESRVAQLEEALAKFRSQQPSDTELRKATSPVSTGGGSSASPSVRQRTIKEEEEEGSEQDLSQDFEGLKVETDGRISFHGPTSLFQLPSGVPEASSVFPLGMELGARKERLINNAWRERAFEQLAAMPVRFSLSWSVERMLKLDQEPFQYLLDSHWCWIQPLFNFVYRPAFTRSSPLYYAV